MGYGHKTRYEMHRYSISDIMAIANHAYKFIKVAPDFIQLANEFHDRYSYTMFRELAVKVDEARETITHCLQLVIYEAVSMFTMPTRMEEVVAAAETLAPEMHKIVFRSGVKIPDMMKSFQNQFMFVQCKKHK